ncbi:MAG: xanthine dehydrogenase family protein molybdopterin-binding subunit [Pyrinomonadaceae bacterium MAG19_C2-C3]|nr:xanthine dehydrogenase family protein molybdopterin-binding subunit [Pyrinomonadaceae bacterium MAG19_C2-C3]
MATATNYIGQPTSRVDGTAKVTGAAKYAAEYNVPDLTYGYVVSSEIAKGKITKLDTREALAIPGVLQIFTHENRPNLAWFDSSYKDDIAPPGSPFRPLYDAEVKYSGQPIALVVAEEFEVARYAASLVRVEYAPKPHETDLNEKREEAYEPPKKRSGIPPPAKPRGDAERAFDNAAVQHEAEYRHAIEHHNPMEMHASTVVWEGNGKITVYDKTQGAQNSQGYVAGIFGFKQDDVRVISSYIGGAFGSGLRPQYQLFLAVLAARELKRSVRVTLTRQQMFTFGYRPDTIQRLALGATADGTLEAFMHDALANTSQFEDFQEDDVNWSGLLYKCANTKFTYKLAQLDLYTPIDMRAPGGATGMYAIEAAMDELAYKTGVDPIELRLKNYSEKDQNKDKPYSSKELRECYRQAAEKFGWSKRTSEPRSMRDGKELVGWGMATGIWEAFQQKASAKATLGLDGKLEVGSATTDIGTGTYTIMTQIAAETLGIPIDDVTFKLGDSTLPTSPVEGGSWTASSIGSAVKVVCDAVGEKLFKIAQEMDGYSFADVDYKDVAFSQGKLRLKRDASHAVPIVDVMRYGKINAIEEEATSSPNYLKQNGYSSYAHSAVFVEVKVDEELGMIRVTRAVNAVAGGRILNPKTARSQVLGGVVWGISMALHEETYTDHNLGRFMNHNLAEYHVPVNADIHDIEVIFVEEHDEIVNPIGAKGLGEIGIVGTAAAVANAVYHATGKRVRDLPITIDKLL